MASLGLHLLTEETGPRTGIKCTAQVNLSMGCICSSIGGTGVYSNPGAQLHILGLFVQLGHDILIEHFGPRGLHF
ncbi:hypothetical protein HanIR_Chr17g0892801 [Helianthus annuus]|nr:hypothetical protein HanIR_Chr17g0892801 [Helianthus annuus]